MTTIFGGLKQGQLLGMWKLLKVGKDLVGVGEDAVGGAGLLEQGYQGGRGMHRRSANEKKKNLCLIAALQRV